MASDNEEVLGPFLREWSHRDPSDVDTKLSLAADLARQRHEGLGKLQKTVAAADESLKAATEAMDNVATRPEMEAKLEELAEEQNRERKRDRLSLLVPIVALIVLVVGLLIGGFFAVRYLGQQATDAKIAAAHRDEELAEIKRLADEAKELSEYVVECTTPGDKSAPLPEHRAHECFDASQERQGQAIAVLNDFTLLVAVCSRQYATEPEIRRCVEVEFAKRAMTEGSAGP